mmetsp:Transcript_58708/g.137418  ORF Transcript_58708/g.137418 Transcript_58708/m.137418 type:complete len:129 (-) Transcript_58708:556-942(-)
MQIFVEEKLTWVELLASETWHKIADGFDRAAAKMHMLQVQEHAIIVKIACDQVRQQPVSDQVLNDTGNACPICIQGENALKDGFSEVFIRYGKSLVFSAAYLNQTRCTVQFQLACQPLKPTPTSHAPA